MVVYNRGHSKRVAKGERIMAMLGGWRLTRAGILFIVGVIVLGVLTFATVSFIVQRGEQARRNEAVEIASQQLEEQSEPIASESDRTENTPSEENTESEASTTPQPTNLPETGSELGGVLAMSALALSVAFYVTSRRAVREV